MINLTHLSECSTLIEKSFNTQGEFYLCTDTRTYKHPGIFVAIPGAKVNPLDVCDNLLMAGCPVVVYQKSSENDEKVKSLKLKYPGKEFLAVLDSVSFLQELSQAHIAAWKNLSPRNTVFAISGSNGKTTHKEMLSHILKKVLPGKVVATEKNNNNHLGVPLTLLQVGSETEIVVLELGSNHPGEIKVLCDIARPTAGLTTNIGATHLEFFGTEHAVFEEEGFLFHAINSVTNGQGFFLKNLDDDFLKTLPKTSGTVSYGESADAQARVSYTEHGANITYRDQTISASNLHITGRHNKLNLITCVFIALHFYPVKLQEILSAAAEFKPTKNRSEWMSVEGKSVFLDAYNANPSSMKAALQGFKESVESKGLNLSETCVVLGDMNELGDATPLYHQEVGEYVKKLGFSHVYFVGRYATHYLKGFPEGKIQESSTQFKPIYRRECLPVYSHHFIKGSRSLQLESLFDIT
jgi:UDP-N-acetylmuramoyl-tripeptide--D-alanyl-D-alanine ligase